MFIPNWKKEITTIPNLLSMFRILMIPIYLIVYHNSSEPLDYLLSGGLITASCLTDGLDGFIARKFQMQTTLGKILDPLADKLTQFALCVSLHLRYPAVTPLVYLLIIKEVTQLLGLCYLMKRSIEIPGSIQAGKVSTLILFSSLICMVAFPKLNSAVLTCLVWVDVTVLVLALMGYYFLFWNKAMDIRKYEI